MHNELISRLDKRQRDADWPLVALFRRQPAFCAGGQRILRLQVEEIAPLSGPSPRDPAQAQHRPRVCSDVFYLSIDVHESPTHSPRHYFISILI